jgi:hypothetical protein
MKRAKMGKTYSTKTKIQKCINISVDGKFMRIILKWVWGNRSRMCGLHLTASGFLAGKVLGGVQFSKYG